MQAERPEQIQELRSPIAQWARIWGVPQLGNEVRLRTSSRFQRSLGSYHARRIEITLAAWLIDGPANLLREVLCHEAAHAAVHFVHGECVRPHGKEWRGFMEQAEVPARVRIPAFELPEPQQAVLLKARVWEHRCPVCRTHRLARIRVTRWRCRLCREGGRSGELVIERVANPVAAGR